MNEAYFERILNDAIGKMTALAAHRDAVEVELMKLREMVHATANMLSDEKQKKQYLEILSDAVQYGGIRDASLSDAVRKVLQEARGKLLTVTDVRDRLRTRGFDFAGYSSNPLASISTTLRRFKPSQVAATTVEGVAAYRWIFRFPRLRRKRINQSPAETNRHLEAMGIDTRQWGMGKLSDMK
jgi:hypothetical protein